MKVSAITILNTEFMALIEYARRNPSTVHVDMEKLKRALIELATDEIPHKFNIDGGKSDDPINIAKRQKAELASKKLNSDKVWNQIETVIVGALTGDEKSLTSLYKAGGSALALFSRDKSEREQYMMNLSSVDSFSNNQAFFVPDALVNRYLKNPNFPDRKNMSFDRAMNEVQRTQFILCNYKLDQQNPDGCSYIDGGKNGINILLGDPDHIGILAACGIPVTRDSLVSPEYTKRSTKYRIKLTPEQAKEFESQLNDSSSLLRTKYITLTKVAINKEVGTTVEKDESAPDKENSGQNAMDEKINLGKESMVSDSVSDIDERIGHLDNAIKTVMGAINTYNRSISTVLPKVPFKQRQVSKDADENRLYQIDAISNFAVSFAKVFSVNVKTQQCSVGSTVINVAVFGARQWAAILANMRRNRNIMMVESLADIVNRTATALRGFLSDIVTKIETVYAVAKFGDSQSNSDDKSSDETNLVKAKNFVHDILSNEYKLKSGKTVTFEQLYNDLDNAVEQMEMDNLTLPKQLCDAFDHFSSVISNVYRGQEVNVDFEELMATDIQVITNSVLSRMNALDYWSNMKDKPVSVGNASVTLNSLIHSAMDNGAISNATNDRKLNECIKLIIKYVERPDYDQNSANEFVNNVKMIVDTYGVKKPDTDNKSDSTEHIEHSVGADKPEERKTSVSQKIEMPTVQRNLDDEDMEANDYADSLFDIG